MQISQRERERKEGRKKEKEEWRTKSVGKIGRNDSFIPCFFFYGLWDTKDKLVQRSILENTSLFVHVFPNEYINSVYKVYR